MTPNPTHPMHHQATPSNDELRVILREAMGGEWESNIREDVILTITEDADGAHVITPICRDIWSQEDARLIALAPALAAEVIRLRGGIEATINEHATTGTTAPKIIARLRALLDGGDR